jgi:hypothetical protein
VNGFVEECRREWKRLRVPGTIADEMASDLAADLEEAEADGASAQDVLGSGAADPRAFAAAWATERGLVRPRRQPRFSLRWLLVGALALLVLLTAVVTAGVIVASSGRSSAPLGAITFVAPRPDSTHFASELPQSGMLGTRIGGASLQLPRIWLHPVRPTILHRRPTTFSIMVANSGRALINGATILVRIGTHRYLRKTAAIVPGKVATVQIAVPAGLPPNFTISARTRPVRGERVLGNNQRTWHVSIRT